MKEMIHSYLSVIIRKLEDVVDACGEKINVAVRDQNEHNLDESGNEDVPVGRNQIHPGETDSV